MKRFNKKKMFSLFQVLLLVFILGTATYIIVFDKGNSTNHARGAGDIWWVDVPAIEEAYRELEQTRYGRIK